MAGEFNVGSVVARFKADMSDFNKGLKSAQDGLKKTGSNIASFAKNTAKVMAGIGAVAGVAGGAFLKAGSDVQKMKVALTTAFQGSEEEANKAFDTISDFAKKTPFQLGEVLQGFLKLKNMGLDPSEEALTSYGNTASSMGKSLNDMVEAVADAATGEFERLKEFGIRSSKEGDRVKFTFQGVTEEVGFNSEEIQQYLMNIGNTQFAGGMEAQSQTLSGQLSTLRDNFTNTMATFAEESGLMEKATNFLENLNTAFENQDDIIKDLEDRFNSLKRRFEPVIDLFNRAKKFIEDNRFVILQFTKAIVDFLMPGFMRIWNVLKDDLLPTFEVLKQEFKAAWPIIKTLAIIIGAALVGAIRLAAELFAGLLKGFLFSVRVLSQVRTKFWNFVTGLVGFFGLLLSSAWSILSSIWNAITSPFKRAIDFVNELLSKFNPGHWFQQKIDWIKEKANGIKNSILDGFQKGVDEANKLLSAFNPAHWLQEKIDWIKGKAEEIKNAIKNPFQKGADEAGQALSGIRDPSTPAGQGRIPDWVPIIGRFATGGIVPGASFSGDRVLAAVNSGEMILNRQQQSNLFEMLQGGIGGAGVTIQNVNIQNRQDADYFLDALDKRQRLAKLGAR